MKLLRKVLAATALLPRGEVLAPEIPMEVERWSNTARLAHEN